jgi:type I restriction enzyme, R subunit
MLPMAANREVYGLLRDGIAVQTRRPDGSLKDERVTLIHWTDTLASENILASSGP